MDFVAGLFLIPHDYNSYRKPHPYFHHDFAPNRKSLSKWGDRTIPIFTNSLGFKDKAQRKVPLETEKHRIVFIGDSFTEGRGVTYEESFSGVVEQRLEGEDYEILNAGVSSYSPKLYYNKMKYLLEEVGLRFDELFVFLDISDIQDEIIYREFCPEDIPFHTMRLYEIRKYMERCSFIYYSLVYRKRRPVLGMEFDENIFSCMKNGYEYMASKDYQKERVYWSLDQEMFERIGVPGLELAAQNIEKLYELCRKEQIMFHLVIYPWPQQILHKDRNSVQVRYWKQFCSDRGISFINLFPPFFDEADSKTGYARYFVDRDVHWSQAGHSLVAGEILEHIDE